MPMAPLKQCTWPGCNERQRGARCPAHAVASWRTVGVQVERLRGRALQRARALLFARYPLCQLCNRRLSEIRDHVVPLAEGGQENESNVQAICAVCSMAKTAIESARGRKRWR